VDNTQAGGDWYDLYPLDHHRVAVVVGDVVGQGPTAAAIMGQLRSALGAHLVAGRSPGAALDHLSDYARRIPGARGSTAICVVVDTVTGELCWASAGHVPPLRITPDGTADHLTGGEGTLLGIHPRPPTPQAEERATPGTSLVLYTDGLVERRGEVVDDGMARLADRGRLAHHEGPDRLAALLLDDDAHPRSADDIALVVARVLPPPLRVTRTAGPQAPAVARGQAGSWAGSTGLPADATDDLVLAISEAVTNAVEHAYPDGSAGPITWSCALAEDHSVQVTVADVGRWRVPPDEPGHRGRSLLMIREVAASSRIASTDSGTTVTFTIPV
jgi:anti-sigma regulatory factor (Ser/Thr protein kinase)